MWCRGSSSPGLLVKCDAEVLVRPDYCSKHVAFIISHYDKSGSQPKAKPRAYLKQLRMHAPWLHHSTLELRNAIFGTVLISKYGCLVTPFRWLNSFSGTKIIIFIINNHALHIWNKLQQQSATRNQDEQFFY